MMLRYYKTVYLIEGIRVRYEKGHECFLTSGWMQSHASHREDRGFKIIGRHFQNALYNTFLNEKKTICP